MKAHILGGIASLVIALGFAGTAAAVGPITSVTISPDTARLSANATQRFTLQGKDANGTTADLTANATFSTTDPSGSTTANVYTAGKAGTWKVVATYNTLSAEASITVTAGTITDLDVNPNSAPEFVTTGEKVSFQASAFDSLDNRLDNPTVSWKVDGGIGTVSPTTGVTTTFTATKPGNGALLATSGSITTRVAVTVEAPPPTNVNATANINSQTNVNRTTSSTNTNTAASSVTNQNANANVNATATPNEKESCTGWSKPTWIWIFIGYLVLVFGGLWLIRSPLRTWWWVIPLGLTVIAFWLYFGYRCYPVYPALPYLMAIAGIVAAVWYNLTAKPKQTT